MSERVVEAIAEHSQWDPTEFEPLYYSIDPDCLDTLFPVVEDDPGNIRQLTFTHENHVINVSGDGSVEVFPIGGQIPDLSPTDSTSSVRGDPEAPD